MIRFRYLLLTSLLALSACFGGGGEIPQDNFYRLADIPARTVSQQMPRFTVLAVSPLSSEAVYRERAILYSDASQPLRLRRYHYYHWADVPSQLIQEQMIDFLRQSGMAQRVVRYGDVPGIDAQLQGTIKRFERVIDRNDVHVVVALELSLRTINSPRQYFQASYTEQKTAQSTAMHDTVRAMSEALESIYVRFVKDLALSGSFPVVKDTIDQ